MPLTIDPQIKFPTTDQRDQNPLNDPNYIDPSTPLVYGPGSGRIISSSAMHQHKDLSYKLWNPDAGEYEDMSKFSKYGVMFSEYGPSWQEQRARAQTTGEKWNHGLKKAAITTGGAIVENTLGIVAGVGELLNGGQYHENSVGHAVDGWNEWARSEMPNYYTEAEQNMGLYDRMGQANFWADKVANGFGYTIGSLATMYLTGGYGAIGLTGKALNIGSKGAQISKANKIYKLYKTAQGTKRGEKLLSMYNKTKTGLYAKNGLLTLEAGAMMSLAESSVEARETQKGIHQTLLAEAQEKYPDGIPASVMEEIDSLSQSAGNSSFIGNMSVLSLSNIAMFNKFLAGNITKQSLKSGALGGGLQRSGAKTVVDKGSASVLGRARKWTKPLRRGALVESLQEGGQYAINIASTEYYTSRFDNKGGITMMQALSEGVSRTFGETNGLESMMIGAIIGGVSGGIGGISQTKKRNKLAKKVQEIVNDDAFMNIIDRTQANARTSHFLEKADAYRAEGKDKLADQAMTQAFISEISTLDNAGSLDFFTERLEDFKTLSDTEFKELFGLAEDTEINKNEIIDNMLEETQNIVRRKEALDLMFPEEATRGLPSRLLGKEGREEEKLRNKETAILKSQMLHQAVFLDQVDNQKRDKAREIDDLYPGITLSTLEEHADLATEEYDLLVEQYIRNAAATNQVDENGDVIANENQIPKDDILAMHNQAYSNFTTGVAESVKNIHLNHPLDKAAMAAQLQEYYGLHRSLQDIMENWNRLQTNEGRSAYVRAALLDGEQSIKDANNRRADEVLDNESDPNAAMDNIPPNASKSKRTEIEEEVKRMKKLELAMMDKYGDPEMSIEEIDRQIELLRQQIEDVKEEPRKVKDINFKIQVLETIKGIKLDPKNAITEEENSKEVETEEETTEEVASEEVIDEGVQEVLPLTSEEERLRLLEETLTDKDKGILALYREKGLSEKKINTFIRNKAKETGKGNTLTEQFKAEDILNNPENYSESVVVNAYRYLFEGGGPINTGGSEASTKAALTEIKKEIEQGEPLIETGTTPGGKRGFQGKYKTGTKGIIRYSYEQLLEQGILKPTTAAPTKVEVEPIDKTEYEVHLEGNWGKVGSGWSVYKAVSVPGVEVGDQRNKSSDDISFIEIERENKRIFTLTDRTVYDAQNRKGAVSVSMVFDKNTTRTLQEVQENLLNLNAEIQATRDGISFSAEARNKIERLDMKEITTPTRNTEMVVEENTSREDVVIKEELSAMEEDRLKNELETDIQADITLETAEVAQLPIGEMDGYYQQLIEEEEELKRRVEKEDDNCKT